METSGAQPHARREASSPATSQAPLVCIRHCLKAWPGKALWTNAFCGAPDPKFLNGQPEVLTTTHHLHKRAFFLKEDLWFWQILKKAQVSKKKKKKRLITNKKKVSRDTK